MVLLVHSYLGSVFIGPLEFEITGVGDDSKLTLVLETWQVRFWTDFENSLPGFELVLEIAYMLSKTAYLV